MIQLLDIDVLIALCDPARPHARAARKAFTADLMRDGWATCPRIENGLLRILGNRKYPSGPGSPPSRPSPPQRHLGNAGPPVLAG